MKRLGLSVAVLLMSATLAFAGNKEKAPFTVSMYQLSSYLQLTSAQVDEVENINEYFQQMQRASLRADEDQKEAKMQKAIYSNLKLMKRVLDADQYRKYVALLNVTNNNNRNRNSDSYREKGPLLPQGRSGFSFYHKKIIPYLWRGQKQDKTT